MFFLAFCWRLCCPFLGWGLGRGLIILSESKGTIGPGAISRASIMIKSEAGAPEAVRASRDLLPRLIHLSQDLFYCTGCKPLRGGTEGGRGLSHTSQGSTPSWGC